MFQRPPPISPVIVGGDWDKSYEKSYTEAMSAPTAAVAELLRRSRLSISELARRAGVSRASVSEYAHGHRQPGLGQLERLAAAAGLQAEVAFTPAWEPRRQQLQDVLALSDALPLRPMPKATQTWAELTTR